MQLSSLLNKIPLVDVHNFVDRDISHITHDSRATTMESIFVAICGERFDGRRFIEQCTAQVIILDHPPLIKTNKTLIIVEDARKAMALTACELFENPSTSLQMVGITGTNGKTTTSWMLYHILRDNGRSVGVIGTLGHHINGNPLHTQDGHTTPESSHIQALLRQMVEQQCQACLMEVSSIGLDLARVDGIDFDVAAFTNFTQDHLDFHSSMKQYFQAKERLFTELIPPHCISILNADKPDIADISSIGQRKWTFGSSKQADWQLSAIHKTLEQTTGTLQYQNSSHILSLPLVGEYNLENAIVAISSAHALGIPVADALNSLQHLPQVAGRMERVDTQTDWYAFVDYAHTPDALEKVLQTLKELSKGQLVVVFGCGGDRDAEKRPLMGQIASTLADKVIVTSDNPRHEPPEHIISDIATGISGDASYITDRREAIRSAIRTLSSQDVLLVAGKGHENYQIIKDTKRHFDDREEILEAL